MSSVTQVSTISASGDPAISRMLALRQRLKKTDPKYRDSFGRRSFDQRTSFGTLVGWRAVGRVEQVWSHLRESLVTLIRDKRDEWEVKRAKSKAVEVGPAEPLFLLQCFLLGVDKEHATPHVCILCDIKWFSAAVRDIIIGSQLLSANGWGCIRLPYTVALLASGQDGAALEMSWGTQSEAFAEYQVFAHIDDLASGFLNGIPIEIRRRGNTVGEACIGGLISSGDEVFALTVAHVFEDQHEKEQHGPTEVEERLIDIDEDELDIFASGDDLTSSGSFITDTASEDPYEAITTTETENSAEDAPLKSKTRAAWNMRIGHLYELPQDRSSDWALIKLSPTLKQHRNLLPHSVATEPNSLTIFSPSGCRQGSVMSSALVGLGYPPKPRQVTVVSMDKAQPTRGDCGSWAFQSDRLAFVGMLVASCSALKEAYLVSLDEVLLEIRAQSGLPFVFCETVLLPELGASQDPGTSTSAINNYLKTGLTLADRPLKPLGDDIASDSGFGSYAHSRAPSISALRLEDFEIESQNSASNPAEIVIVQDLQPSEREWTDLSALQEAYRSVYVSRDHWKQKAAEAETQTAHYRQKFEELREIRRKEVGSGSEPDKNGKLPGSGEEPAANYHLWDEALENALENEYPGVFGARNKWKEMAYQLDERLARATMEQTETKAKWHALIDRNETLEDEKRRLLKEKKVLDNEVMNLKRQLEELGGSRDPVQPGRVSRQVTHLADQGDTTTERKRLSKRFEPVKDEGYEYKSSGSSSSEPRFGRARRVSYIEPFGPPTASRRARVSTSTSPGTGSASSDTEPVRVGSVIYETPSDIFEADGNYYPYPLPSGRSSRFSKKRTEPTDLLSPAKGGDEDVPGK